MSGNDDRNDEIDQAQREQQRLLQQQIDQSNAEVEQARQSVFNQRLNIIRSQGAPSWTPVVAQANPPGKKPKPPRMPWGMPLGAYNAYKNNPISNKGQ